jgi:membrane protease YdiL (CAAX protease family)
VVVILLIGVGRKLLSSDLVFFVGAALMLGVPFIMASEVKGLRWNPRGILIGLLISVVILSLYMLVIRKAFDFTKVSFSLIMVHLLLIAIPEEVFFRGYLQEKIGNDLKGILVVSLLFAVGHVVTRCLFSTCNGGGYSQALLTFFPSIVMGYVYLISGTLWANILFHFLANVVYVATGGL